MRDVTDIFIRAFARPVWRAGLARKSSSAMPIQAGDERTAAWSRFGSLLKIGAWLVTVAGLGFAVNAFGHLPSTAPVELTHTVSFSQFGLKVVLPSSWKVDSSQSGAEFKANHSTTDAKLVGAITVSNPPAPDLDTVIDRVIEDERARVGNVESISRGVMGVGLLEARWVKLSAMREGELVRMRTVAVRRGQSTLTLTCSGGAAAQKACDSAIRTVAMAR